MADEIKIEVALEGADEAKKGLEELGETSEEIAGKIRNQTTATTENTAATQGNTAATQGNTAATQQNTAATQGNAAAQRDAAKSLDAAAAAGEKAGRTLKSGVSLSGAFHKAQDSLARLMRGDVAGAMKQAQSAVVDFGKAVLLNPWMAAIAAGVAIVKGLASAWNEAQERAQEYAESLKWAADFEARAAKMRKGAGEDENPFAGKTDEQLEREARAIERIELPVAEEAANRWKDAAMEQAETARNQSIAGRKWRGVGKWIGGFVGADVKSEDEKAKQMQQGAEGALAEEEGVRARLQAIRDEQARRKQVQADAEAATAADEAKAQDEQARAAAAQARLDARKRYDTIAEEAERKGGNGQLASMTAQKVDLEAAAAAEQNAEKRVELLAKAYDLERKIADTVNREAENAERQDAARQKRQAEWMRNRRLTELEAPDKVKALEAEIAHLRRGPRTAETESVMRRAIDERDAVKKEVETKGKETADKQDEWLHRNDTDGERLKRIRAGLTDAKIGGDKAKMLELMMMGEEIADGYEEEQTPRQKRRAEKRAEREARAAMREAKLFRKQVGAIEEGWRAGDKTAQEKIAEMAAGGNAAALAKISTSAALGNTSAQEMAARLTTDKNGVPSAIKGKDGKLFEVKGIDRSNQLLEAIVKSLA